MSEYANPEMLILARELRMLTQTKLAETSGIDQGTLSKYENGIKPVLEHDLVAIADALKFPVKFFYRSGKRYGAESGEVFHRKRQSVPAPKLRLINAQLNLFRMDTEKLLAAADVEQSLVLPTYHIREFGGDIEQIAATVRAAWKLPPGPIKNLVKVLEDASIFIHSTDFGTRQIDETVQWIEPNPPIVLINDHAPADRIRFTLAHTLGHLVMHHRVEPYPEMEDEADQFAGAFLMPAEDIREELAPITIEHMLQLKPAWGVSVQALIYRAHEIGEIDDKRYRSLFQTLSRMGYRRIEPFPLLREKPTLFNRLLKLYENELNYESDQMAELLSLREEYFRDLYLPDKPHLRLVSDNKSKRQIS